MGDNEISRNDELLKCLNEAVGTLISWRCAKRQLKNFGSAAQHKELTEITSFLLIINTL